MKQFEICSAAVCTNNVSDDVVLFRFPKDPARCRIWMETIERKDLFNKSSEYIWRNCRLCGDHFEDNAFKTHKRKRLIDDAYPVQQSVLKPPRRHNNDGVIVYSDPAILEKELSAQCRCCMSTAKSTFSHLFESEIIEIFQGCTNLSANTDDGLPNSICMNCLKACQFWKQFRDQCVRIDSQLRRRLIHVSKVSQDCGEEVEFNRSSPTFPTTHKYWISDSESSEADEPIGMDNCSECVLCSSCDAKLYGDEYINHVCDLNICVNNNVENLDNSTNNKDEGDSDECEGIDDQSDLDDKDILIDKEYCSDTNKDKLYVCNKCPWRLSTLKRYQEHKLFHEIVDEIKCRKCNKTFIQVMDLNKHCKNMHPNEHHANYICKICKMEFYRYDRLRAHHYRHDGTKDMMCNQCGEMFITNTDLRTHISRRHVVRPKIFKCEECHKIFNTNAALRGHQKIVHVKERAFGCHICPKNFKAKPQLRAHILTHLEKKFCKKCQRGFKTNAILESHMLKCKGPSDSTKKKKQIRPTVICTICQDVFANIRALESHLRDVHRDEGIDIHQAIENNKHEVCRQCGKRYIDKFALNLHINKTHRQKHVKCEYCGQTFRCSTNLIGHIASKHKDAAPATLALLTEHKEQNPEQAFY